MTKIKLNKTNKFYIEPRRENQTRLIVLEGENEYVCRIEKISVLEKFIGEKEGLIFKGRLQLSLANDKIEIIAKGVKIGSVEVEKFEAELAKIKEAQRNIKKEQMTIEERS